MQSIIKAFLINMAINAVWYGTEYLQYRELQWGRHCDDIVSFLYFMVLLFLFEKEKRKGRGDPGKTKEVKRVFTDRMDQLIIIPAIGILWNGRGILLSFAWLNVGCSILIFDKQK